MDALEAGGSSCHDCTLKYKVVVNKEALDVRKEKEATEAKKQLVNQRKVVKSILFIRSRAVGTAAHC